MSDTANGKRGGAGRRTDADLAPVDNPMLTFEADVVESERLSRLRQSRILRFQIRWMETLAEHARRQLTELGTDTDTVSSATLPGPEELERAAQEQSEVTGEIPRSTKRTGEAMDSCAAGSERPVGDASNEAKLRLAAGSKSDQGEDVDGGVA